MFYLAKRQLLARKIQTLLITLGITLGSAAYVIISGMFVGFQSYITNQLINNDATIRVSARQELIDPKVMQETFFGKNSLVNWLIAPSGRRDHDHIENPAEWTQRLHKDKNVEAFALQLEVQALVHKGPLSTTLNLTGTDPKTQVKVTNINDYMVSGSFSNLKSGGNQIIMGDGLLAGLGARMGSTVLITGRTNEAKPFKVAGVFHTGVPNFDNETAFANLNDIQKINGTPGQISDIAIRLYDVKKAHGIAAHWSDISRDKVQSWDQMKQNVMAVFKTQTAVRYFVTFSILLVAGFGIYNVLSVLINQKKKEIAILRAIGYLPKEIRLLFLYQGLVMGILGGILGLIIGFIICHYLEMIPLFKDSTGKINHMHMAYDRTIYIYGFLLAMLSASIASFFPAYKAGKMTPIDIIRESA